MIQLLTGDNSFEIRARRTRVIAEYRQKHGAESVKVIDGTQVSRGDLPQLLQGMSLFAPEQLIVVDEASAQKDIWERVAELLPELSETTDLMLVAPSADKRTKTYKWLQKSADVVEVKQPNEAQLVNWLQTIAREQGIELSGEVTRYMIEYVGPDQWRLSGDVKKLSLAGKPVTRELIRELLIPSPQAHAFELLDAALTHQPETVDELLGGVRIHEDPYRFFGLLASQVYAIMVVAAAGNRSPDEVAKASGIHPFVVRKTSATARRLSVIQRNRMAEAVATCDMQLKSSGADPWVLITALLKHISAR